jgi:hypothetical protein
VAHAVILERGLAVSDLLAAIRGHRIRPNPIPHCVEHGGSWEHLELLLLASIRGTECDDERLRSVVTEYTLQSIDVSVQRSLHCRVQPQLLSIKSLDDDSERPPISAFQEGMADFWLSSEKGGLLSTEGYNHSRAADDAGDEDAVGAFDRTRKQHQFLIVTFYRGIW